MCGRVSLGWRDWCETGEAWPAAIFGPTSSWPEGQRQLPAQHSCLYDLPPPYGQDECVLGGRYYSMLCQNYLLCFWRANIELKKPQMHTSSTCLNFTGLKRWQMARVEFGLVGHLLKEPHVISDEVGIKYGSRNNNQC